MKQKLRIILKKMKLKITELLENNLNWIRYPKWSIHRTFYKDDSIRYKSYSENDKFVNLGAGSYFFHPRWECLDFYKDEMKDVHKNFIPWDFTKNKELPNKYRLAYCSHVVEHIPEKDIEIFFGIVFRALEPKSIFRIICPNADLAYEAYGEGRYDFFEIYNSKINHSINPKYYLEYLLLDFFATSKRKKGFNDNYAEEIRRNYRLMKKKEFLNYLISGITTNTMDGMDHVNWYDFEKIKNLLQKAGFSKIYISGFSQSRSPAMRDIPRFDGMLPCLTLYVEAIK